MAEQEQLKSELVRLVPVAGPLLGAIASGIWQLTPTANERMAVAQAVIDLQSWDANWLDLEFTADESRCIAEARLDALDQPKDPNQPDNDGVTDDRPWLDVVLTNRPEWSPGFDEVSLLGKLLEAAGTDFASNQLTQRADAAQPNNALTLIEVATRLDLPADARSHLLTRLAEIAHSDDQLVAPTTLVAMAAALLQGTNPAALVPDAVWDLPEPTRGEILKPVRQRSTFDAWRSALVAGNSTV